MNLQEFAALKPGDKIVNAMSNSRGEVVEANATGVHVCWSNAGLVGQHRLSVDGATRHYSVQSTIWFHWSKVELTPGGEHSCPCGRGDAPCPGPDGKPLCAA